jgi:hypothetical protein
MVLALHALNKVHVRLKSISNEGDFTLEVETVLRLYCPQDCSGVTELYNMVLRVQALQTVEVKLKTVSKERHFTLEVGTVISPYLP